MGRNIDVYSNVNFLRSRLLARDVHAGADAYTRQLARQNSGLTCEHCDCETGHKVHCPLINREAAEAASFARSEPSEADRIAAHGFGISL
jgi:hypothetical protein